MKGLPIKIVVLMLAFFAVSASVTPTQAAAPSYTAIDSPGNPSVGGDEGDIGITRGDGDDIGGGDEVDPPPTLREIDPSESSSAQGWWSFITRLIQSFTMLRSV